MKMTLAPELADLIRKKVDAGEYRDDPEDVVRQALELLDRADHDPALRTARLKAEIDKGLADFEAGRYTVINNEEELNAFFADL